MKPTLFAIVDTETTKKNGLVFDMSWKIVDRKGTIYSLGSVLFKDVLRIDDPFYKDKISDYWLLVSKQKIKPHSFRVGREVFLSEVKKFKDAGHRVVFCAYNARFDAGALSTTSQRMLGVPFMTFVMEVMCLWHAFVLNCPMDYFKECEISDKGNPRTNAENVYRYLIDNKAFEEKHIAHSDVIIEVLILEKILQRKKKLPIYNKLSDLPSHVWKIAKERGQLILEQRKLEMGRPIV